VVVPFTFYANVFYFTTERRESRSVDLCSKVKLMFVPFTFHANVLYFTIERRESRSVHLCF
jgi:hypothetical protein